MSDKTYAETQGEAPFDWWKALENPRQYRHTELIVRAMDWVTCACGNQCAIIPRSAVEDDSNGRRFGGAPYDSQLYELGVAFARKVNRQLWGGAKQTLAQIEARSAVLIAEELAKRNEAITP